MAKAFEIQKKVYLADTDVTGIAYYAKHLEWLEMARVEWISAIYKPLTRMIAEDGISFVPINVNITYKAPAVFEDILTVKLWIKELDQIKLLLGYDVTKKVSWEHAEKEVLVAKADISMLCVNITKGNKPAKIPDHLVDIFKNQQMLGDCTCE
jgi:acyl-CoA thioester hydrolase